MHINRVQHIISLPLRLRRFRFVILSPCVNQTYISRFICRPPNHRVHTALCCFSESVTKRKEDRKKRVSFVYVYRAMETTRNRAHSFNSHFIWIEKRGACVVATKNHFIRRATMLYFSRRFWYIFALVFIFFPFVHLDDSYVRLL